MAWIKLSDGRRVNVDRLTSYGVYNEQPFLCFDDTSSDNATLTITPEDVAAIDQAVWIVVEGKYKRRFELMTRPSGREVLLDRCTDTELAERDRASGNWKLPIGITMALLCDRLNGKPEAHA